MNRVERLYKVAYLAYYTWAITILINIYRVPVWLQLIVYTQYKCQLQLVLISLQHKELVKRLVNGSLYLNWT